MSSKQILIGQLWTREGANIQKITQCDGKQDSPSTFPMDGTLEYWAKAQKSGFEKSGSEEVFLLYCDIMSL